IDRGLFERYGDVQAFALNPLASDAGQWNAGEGSGLVRLMNAYVKNYGVYRLALLVDASGKTLAASTVDASGKAIDTKWLYATSFRDAPWLKKALGGEFLSTSSLTGTVVEQPHYNAEVAKIYKDDGYVMTFAAPV